MTNSTNKTLISVDLPDLPGGKVRSTSTGLLINAVDEVFPKGLRYEHTLDANGEDDGTYYLATPDATGTASAQYKVEYQESGSTVWNDFGFFIAVAYSASAQELGALLEADSTAVAATQTGITTAEATWLAAELAAIGATADGNLLQSDGTNAEDSGIAAADVAQVTGATFSGTLAMADNAITRPVFTDYGETVNALGDTGGGAVSIDLESGNVVTATVSTSTTTFSFTNFPASGTYGGVVVILTNGGSQTVNWTNVIWADGSAPTLTAAGVDRLVFDSVDGGTTIYGFSAGVNFS